MIIDTHAHLTDPLLYEDLTGILSRASAAGVGRLLCVGYEYPSSVMSLRLAEKYPQIYAMVGFHPHDAVNYSDDIDAKLRLLAASPRVVAIGEIGLDYHYDNSPRDLQKQVFRRQIALAKDLKKPVSIHDREAHGDTLQILKDEGAAAVGGIIHCFSGSYEMAKQCIDMGFLIAFGGTLTYKNARNLQEVAAKLPLQYLVVETDCPYLTPQSLRGKVNEPANVVLVGEKLAELHKISYDKLCEQTTQNLTTLLGAL